ncbi:type II toxin-antitoxin system mRNA interferase toxin, RelE/StbE family [Rudanella lutea]|uniref:type II toxin-antitoxin system RelE/ParE family toxin n=1 Tax=Rudanella lutea TaxID=451374 RepID=UPI000365D3A9
MGQVIWTEQAYNDLHAIYEFISAESERYATLLTDKLFSRTQSLISFPEMGRMVPEIGKPTVRELIEGNYRIIYEIISEDIILIQTVWHSARPLPL